MLARRRFPVFFTAALVGAVLVQLSSGLVVRAAAGYSLDTFTVAERRKDQIQPRVAGDWVVWKDYRNLSMRQVDESPNGQVFAYNLSTGEERQLSNKDADHPSISGTLVVWAAAFGRGTEIQGIDLVGGELFGVTDANGRQERPAISDTIVVWQDNRSGNWDIFMRDLQVSSEVPVVEDLSDQELPAVSGHTIVWQDWRGSGPNIYGFDLDSQQEFRVTSTNDAFEPAVSGRWVAWHAPRERAIYAQNLDDGTPIRLNSASAGNRYQVAISGDLVVWTDERNGNRDIWGYDLRTKTEFPVTQRATDQDYPAVDGARIVWSDATGANRDIRGANVNLPERATAALP
ncbi:MAG: hypothetical protein IT307_09840 [Chloroflexi bacterium]|nr:hypothetical protein [Chloroflexota bacterium]